MPEFLYRFRPVSNLLGVERESELEGTYIYFCAPEKLNDPLEGHREVVWRGDGVLWHNFLLHYLRCLFIRNIQYFTDDLNLQAFPIFPNLSLLPPGGAERVENCFSKFFKCDNVIRHIEHLSMDMRPVKKSELLLHLRSIHSYAMHVISDLLVEDGLVEKGYGLNGASEDELLAISNGFLDALDKQSYINIDGDLDYSVLSAMKSQDLISGYHRAKLGQSNSWMRLCIDFPDEFLKSRHKLTRSEWYVSCFMEDCKNSSIWGTYGDNHRGVCLKFKVGQDSGHPSLSLYVPEDREGGVKWKTNTVFHFNKVSYAEKSPDLDFFCSLATYPVPQLMKEWYVDSDGKKTERMNEVFGDIGEWRKAYHQAAHKSLTIKTRHWASEQEYRLILSSFLNTFISEENRKLAYDFNDLDGIIFGINTAESDKYKLMEMVEKMCKVRDRAEFTFYQSYYDAETESVSYRPVAYVGATGVKPHKL